MPADNWREDGTLRLRVTELGAVNCLNDPDAGSVPGCSDLSQGLHCLDSYLVSQAKDLADATQTSGLYKGGWLSLSCVC